MTGILTECANNVVGRLINLILSEAHNACCFNCIVDDFEKEKPELEAKWRTISKDIEDARRRAEDIRNDVTHWQVEAEKLINEDTKTKMSCFGGRCPNCIWRYHRGKELVQMTDNIKRLKVTNFESVGRAPHLPGVESHSSQGFIHFESRDFEYNQVLDAVADENNYITAVQGMGGAGKTTLAKEVGRKLNESGKFDHVIFTTVSINPDIKKIQDSIAGPLGLSLKDKNEWERRNLLWKRLNDGQKILIILDDVWEPVSFEEIGIPSSDSHKNCRVLLTSRDVRVCKTMGCLWLIQLGLLSNQDAWILFKKHVGIDDSFPKSFQEKGQEITNECKNLPVAIAAMASTLKNRPLEEWDAALTALRNPLPMLDVDENLIKIYKGLRYSYDNMKSDRAQRLFLLLSVFPATIEVRTEFLTRMGIGVGLFGEVDKYCEARSQVLSIKNKLVDSCLWLEVEDDCVKLHDLVHEVALWIANGDIQLIVLSEKKRKALFNNEKKMKYLYCDDLQVSDMDVFPSWFGVSELEILLIYMEASDSVKVPNAFFEKMTRLRVLLLTHNALSTLALTLPVSLQLLSNIRFLILVDWKLGDISILGTLGNLETLDLYDCSVSELPNEITKLEKLRLLTIGKCEIERNNPFEVIGRCLQLEELYFAGNELPILDTVNEVEMILQNTTFPTLNKYYIEKDEEINYSISKSVCLPNIDGLISEATFMHLVQGAEILNLKGIEGEWRNLIPKIVPLEDNGMNDLLELSLESCFKIQCLVNTKHSYSHVPNVLSKLVALNLESMGNLEELCIGPLPLEFLKSLERLRLKECENLQGMLFKSKLNLCNLKIMELVGCPMLASLFQPSTARSLVLLEELRIYKCDQLTNIITGEVSKDPKEERLDGDNDHTGYDSVFPRLKILEIKKCDRLECVLSVLFPQDIPLLETISIVDCVALKHIFGRYHDQDVILASLQKMELAGLSNFVSISLECYPPMSSSSMKRSSFKQCSKAKQQDPNNQKIFSWSCINCYCNKYGPNLRSATSLKMPVVSKVGQTDCSISLMSYSSPHFVGSFQSVSKQSQGLNILTMRNTRVIELKGLDTVKCLFNLSIASSMTLEILRIETCPGLKHIIDIGDECDGKNCNAIFPNLKDLSVYDCGELEYMFDRYPLDHQNYTKMHIHFPALEKLGLYSLPNFTNICPQNSLSKTLPSLKEFYVDGCPLLAVTFLNEFMVDSDTRQWDHTITKEFQASSSECVQTFDIAQSPSGYSLNLFNIRDMTLKNCPKIISLFTFSVASKMLLERLTIIGCDGLKHVIIDTRDDEGRKVCNSVFPKLKEFIISSCDQLEYVTGPNHNEDHNHNLEFHMDLPALEQFILRSLSDMINICPRSYVVTWPSLKVFELDRCPQFNSDSDLVVSLYSRQPVNIANKDTRGIEKHFLSLESVCIKESSVESIFHLDALQIIERPLSVALKYLELDNLPQMMHICVASKSSFTFQHLETLLIVGCAKLELIFPISILRCLPELKRLEIRECKELKQIIEEDIVENQKLSPQPCFPKLTALIVRQCHKLKRFIASIDLPNLEFLIINGAFELEELFGCEQGQGNDEIRKVDVKLPKLKVVIFMDLSSLCQGAETLQTARHRVVHNCPKISLTSTTSLQEFRDDIYNDDLEDLQFNGFSESEIINMLVRGTKEVTTDYLVGPEIQRASGSMLPSSQTNEELEEEFVGKVASSEIPALETSPKDSKSELIDRTSPSPLDLTPYKAHSQELAEGPSMGEPFFMNQQKPLKITESTIEIPQAIKRGVEDGTTSVDAMIVNSQHKSYALERDPMKETTSLNLTEDIDEKETTITEKDPASVKLVLTTPLPLHIFEDQQSTRVPRFLDQQHALGETITIEAIVRECTQEVSNLTDKEGEISVASVDCTVTRRNEEPKKEIIERSSISEMSAVAASPTDIDMIKGSSPSLSNIPLPKTHSNELVDGLSMGEACLTNQQKPLGETIEVRLSQIETYTNKESGGHPINIQDFREDDLISLFQLEEEDGDGQIGTSSVSVVSANHPDTKDNLVVMVLADLEELLKMPLKDIASSEANSLRLLRALNFLSRLSLEHVTISDALKAIIDSLHKEFPGILCSFKQAFATTNKFAVLEEKEKSMKEELAQRKEVAIALVSKISKARNFMDEAKQKEAMLKEQLNRLENEIKDCEANSSSLQEEKKKFVAETIGYKKQFETVRNAKSQMVGDQRKAQQKLFEVDYKWSVLCSQFEHKRITTHNPS